jgi:integrase
VLICTGMRKGEALGLHWVDVDLEARLLLVRHTLVAVDNSRLVFNTPKTPGSSSAPGWTAATTRVRAPPPLRLGRSGGRAAHRVHDLRHLAATIMIASGVPLAMVSKTLRHSTPSTTVDIYGHLTRQAAQDAVDPTATALDNAERKARRSPSGTRSRATTLRPQRAQIGNC